MHFLYTLFVVSWNFVQIISSGYDFAQIFTVAAVYGNSHPEYAKYLVAFL
jgi:hypothetical protein